MMIKKICISAIFLVQYALLFGQDNDFGIWSGVNLEYGLTKKTDLNLNASWRTFQNAGSTDLFYVEGGLSHKLFKGFSVSGFYRFILKNEDFKGYFNRHRFYCDVKYSYPVARFKFGLRLRVQGQYNSYWKNINDELPDFYTRLKASANYNIPSFPLNPFVSVEIYHPINSYNKPFIDQKRFSGGVQYKISKKLGVDVAFIYENDVYPRPSNLSIISTELNISL